MTYAIEGMRAVLLRTASWVEVWYSLGPLLVCAVVILPLSLVSFQYAVRRVRITKRSHTIKRTICIQLRFGPGGMLFSSHTAWYCVLLFYYFLFELIQTIF